MSFFKITDRNYIGTPSGVLMTDKTIDQITWEDLTSSHEGEYEYAYYVDADDNALVIGDRPIALIHQGFYYSPNEPEQTEQPAIKIIDDNRLIIIKQFVDGDWEVVFKNDTLGVKNWCEEHGYIDEYLRWNDPDHYYFDNAE
jgi:hypothetical protein